MRILRRIRNFVIGVTTLSLVLAFANPNLDQSSIQAKNSEQRILIDKSRKKLYLYDGERIIDSASCSFGYGEFSAYGQKKMQGDNKTPEGEYSITEKHPSKKYSYFMTLSYPNKNDAKRGLEEKIITQEQYEQIVKADSNNTAPPQYTHLGGLIGIHGEKDLGWISLSTEINWTRGCISLSDEDIQRLYQVVKIGTKVKIIK